ncbi:MAG: hypothetical protein JWP30_66 [Homoserinimonas sp.]|nr:hypothetical protein [Homoserinimonas sp.]
MAAPYPAPPFSARGAVSAQLLDAFRRPAADAVETLEGFSAALDLALEHTPDIVHDDDIQLTLLLLHGLHYGSVVEADEDWEWHPLTVAGRVAVERAFERHLRAEIDTPALPSANSEAVAAALFALTAQDGGPSLSRYIAKRASRAQMLEYVALRSVYTLKEADAQSWVLPRLTGRPKAALIEIQADEYGGGHPERMHSAIYACTMRGVGLDDRYGTYVDCVPAISLASFNMTTMFGLNRRLRGASVGHLAAFEMTSSVPNRLIGDGFRRLGYGPEVTWYFDEHVEADAVHEQIAGRDLAGTLAEDDPTLLADIMFGANAALTIDGWAAGHTLSEWTAGRSALRVPLPGAGMSEPRIVTA